MENLFWSEDQLGKKSATEIKHDCQMRSYGIMFRKRLEAQMKMQNA